MSYARTMRVLKRRGQWCSVKAFLRGQRVHESLRIPLGGSGPAPVEISRTPTAPRLEDYDRTPAASYPEGEP